MDFRWQSLIRPAYFVPESVRADKLFSEMQKRKQHMAIVLDEYGAAVGMISLEDLLEEIVGEIRDEYDEDEEDLIQKINDREYLIEGSVKLDDINDALDLTLHSDEYDSVGGLIIEKLDHLPDEQESVITEENIRLTVEKMDKNRIESVRLVLPESPKEEDISGTEG